MANPYLKITTGKFDSNAGSALAQQGIQHMANAISGAGKSYQEYEQAVQRDDNNAYLKARENEGQLNGQADAIQEMKDGLIAENKSGQISQLQLEEGLAEAEIMAKDQITQDANGFNQIGAEMDLEFDQKDKSDYLQGLSDEREKARVGVENANGVFADNPSDETREIDSQIKRKMELKRIAGYGSGTAMPASAEQNIEADLSNLRARRLSVEGVNKQNAQSGSRLDYKAARGEVFSEFGKSNIKTFDSAIADSEKELAEANLVGDTFNAKVASEKIARAKASQVSIDNINSGKNKLSAEQLDSVETYGKKWKIDELANLRSKADADTVYKSDDRQFQKEQRANMREDRASKKKIVDDKAAYYAAEGSVSDKNEDGTDKTEAEIALEVSSLLDDSNMYGKEQSLMAKRAAKTATNVQKAEWRKSLDSLLLEKGKFALELGKTSSGGTLSKTQKAFLGKTTMGTAYEKNAASKAVTNLGIPTGKASTKLMDKINELAGKGYSSNDISEIVSAGRTAGKESSWTSFYMDGETENFSEKTAAMKKVIDRIGDNRGLFFRRINSQ